METKKGRMANYYYSRLNDEQKKIYASFQLGIRGCVKRIKIPMRPANEISLIYRAVLADHPMYFYTAGFSWQTDTYKQKNLIMPDYGYSRMDIYAYTKAVANHLRVYDIVKEKSDREKEQFVHDYCAEHFTYGDIGSESHTVLGLVRHQTGMCEGIANYVKVALAYLGVNSLVVLGKANNDNPNNPWYGIEGGKATDDKVFLLSLDEVCRYFGDSMANLKKKGSIRKGNNYWIDDGNNTARVANDESKRASWWWLRSPGYDSYDAARVDYDGIVNVSGYYVRFGSGGVRPALWLNL